MLMIPPTRFRQSKRLRSGQGMLEAIIAVGIILTATISGLTLIISSIQASRGARERLTATNLAREGIEAVRIIRDTNWLASREWTTSWAIPGDAPTVEVPVFNENQLPSNDPNAQRWSFDRTVTGFGDAKAILVLTPGGHYMNQVSAPPGSQLTNYKRLLTVTRRSASAYMVHSEVRFGAGGSANQAVTIEEVFTNWKI